MKEIARGAEATILLDKNIVKHRVPKTYRLKQLDEALRGTRTRREAKVIEKLTGIAPALISSDGKERLELEYIEGDVVKDILDSNVALAKKIGEAAAAMHEKNIIHGDLTTSNMILDKRGRMRIIDYGLSFESHKVEDKAVDLHLFLEAVESKHFRNQQKIWRGFLEGYNPHNKEGVLKRLSDVEKRGRNKEKY